MKIMPQPPLSCDCQVAMHGGVAVIGMLDQAAL
jgi:hypothetical protein